MTVDEHVLARTTALVTGGAGGIGAAIVRALSAQGARVTVLDSSPLAEAVAEEVGGRAVVGDIRSERVLLEAVSCSTSSTGGLDILVNAAGIQVRTAAVEIASDAWQRLLDINLTAAYNLIKLAKQPLSIARGAIVNVASLSADRAVAGIAPYGSTKAALVQLTKGLAVELGPEGIRVNAVAPGYIDTPMTAEVLDDPDFRSRVLTRIPLRRLADGEDVADVVAFLVSKHARYVTGVVLPVDGGYSIT